MPSKKHLAGFVAAFSVILGSLAMTTPLYAASSEQVLYAFQGGKSDGLEPLAGVMFDSSGNLYGTTYEGGFYNGGIVFELTPNNGQWTEKVHTFQPKYGEKPKAGLIMDSAGNLYGTTYYGGAYGYGTVFELTPNNGEWAFKVLHAFINNGKDGLDPTAGLVFDAAGNLYGTTALGGSSNLGTLFKLTLNNGKWIYKVLHSFSGKDDVNQPQAALIFDTAGNLYGTTYGTVFELTPSGGKWTEKVLHKFKHNGYDGYACVASLIFDTAGNLYGTTFYGGADSSCNDFTGCGTVFELIPNNGKWTEKLLHSFHDKGDGAFPLAGLIFDAAGNLYGTTGGGGLTGDGSGVVFELTPHGSNWTETVLYAFSVNGRSDGGGPTAGLIFDKAGNLYSTTEDGGGTNNGVVFEVTP